jgi:hypothetical protein
MSDIEAKKMTHIEAMKEDLEQLMKEILGWPERDQAELAAYAQSIRARRSDSPRASDVGRSATRGAPSHARRTHTSERQMEAFWQRHGG